MPYEVTGNEFLGFLVENKTKGIKYRTCPCCDKTLDTKDKAEMLAQNLTRLETISADEL